jgi:hypothetical protein
MIQPTRRHRFRSTPLASAAMGAALLGAAMVGCSRHNSTTDTPPSTGTGSDFGYAKGKEVTGPDQNGGTFVPNPAGPVVAGAASGMGFNTGDASQTGGMGTGLMGYHDVGAAGTSGAITDATIPSGPAAEDRGSSKPESR